MSVFKVDPKNILGLDYSKFKSQLLSLALAEPHTYFKLRDDVYTKIVEDSVKIQYNLYWYILKAGKTGVNADNGTGGEQITIATEKYTLPGTTEKRFNFIPNLPESEINTFALEVAEAVKDIAERAIDKIMPLEIKDLAVRRSKELLPSSATGSI